MSTREIAEFEQTTTGFRKSKPRRLKARKELQTKFGLTGILLAYYVICIIWMWRQLRYRE